MFCSWAILLGELLETYTRPFCLNVLHSPLLFHHQSRCVLHKF